MGVWVGRVGEGEGRGGWVLGLGGLEGWGLEGWGWGAVDGGGRCVALCCCCCLVFYLFMFIIISCLLFFCFIICWMMKNVDGVK